MQFTLSGKWKFLVGVILFTTILLKCDRCVDQFLITSRIWFSFYRKFINSNFTKESKLFSKIYKLLSKAVFSFQVSTAPPAKVIQFTNMRVPEATNDAKTVLKPWRVITQKLAFEGFIPQLACANCLNLSDCYILAKDFVVIFWKELQRYCQLLRTH